MIWQVQEAKSKFSRLVEHALEDGPQVVTRHGERVVVVVSYEVYQEMNKSKPSLMRALLNSPLRGVDLPIPERDKGDIGRPLPEL